MGPLGSKRYARVACFDMEIKPGTETSKPHVVLSLRGLKDDDVGRNFFKRCYLSPAKEGKSVGAADITAAQLRALGWTGNTLSRAMSEGLGTKVADAQLTVREYNGRLQEEVTGIYEVKEPTRQEQPPIEAAELASLDELFASHAVAVDPMPITDLNRAPETLPPAVKRAAPPVAAAPDVDF